MKECHWLGAYVTTEALIIRLCACIRYDIDNRDGGVQWNYIMHPTRYLSKCSRFECLGVGLTFLSTKFPVLFRPCHCLEKFPLLRTPPSSLFPFARWEQPSYIVMDNIIQVTSAINGITMLQPIPKALSVLLQELKPGKS